MRLTVYNIFKSDMRALVDLYVFIIIQTAASNTPPPLYEYLPESEVIHHGNSC